MLTLTRPDNMLPSSGKVYIPTNALKTGIERDLRLSERAAAATPPPSSSWTLVFGMRDEPPSCCIHQAIHRGPSLPDSLPPRSRTRTRTHACIEPISQSGSVSRRDEGEDRRLVIWMIWRSPLPPPQPPTTRGGFVMFWDIPYNTTLRMSGTTWSAVQLYLYVNSIVTLWGQLLKYMVPDFFNTQYRHKERPLFSLLIVY